MVGPVFLPAVAALLVGQGSPSAKGAPFSAAPLARDSAALAGAIDGQRLDLALRGAGTAVHAKAQPAEGGCATRIAASAPGVFHRRTRLLRWHDVAWTGALPNGRVMVAFFEPEGRLPGDRLTFAPADPAAFRAAVARVRDACRSARPESERISSGEYTGWRSCYFVRLPSLELIEAGGPADEPTRAVLTVLAQETPEAELRLIVERPGGAEAAGWWRPDVAFTIASPTLKSLRIAGARFALDGVPVDAPHSLAIYNDTRLRIRMGPASAVAADGAESFYRRLAASERATVTLLDAKGYRRAEFSFDAGSSLVAARTALQRAAWSCAGSTPAPEPAANAQTAG